MTKRKSKTSSPVGEAVHVFTARIEDVEREYQHSSGEVTDEVDLAEILADQAADQALESLAFFFRWLDSSFAAVKAERDRLAKVEAGLESRKQWATVQTLAILDQIGAKSRTVGTFRISSRIGKERVEVDPDIDLETLPEEIKRYVPPTPGGWAVDKNAARDYLKRASDPEDDETLPVAGLRIVRGDRSINVK